jgi:Tfp pilus assembly protein PilF
MFTANPTRKQLSAIICLTLALVTATLYWPVMQHQFINIDDDQYITNNPHIQAGLTWPGLAWAFRTGYAANWHPLTWISHMLDCQLFGLNPAGHHLTNLLFHIANTLLLFLWLKQLTGALWRSALVAALFAWHPLHVESVAWAAERKDVLSAFFWMLTLIAYTRFALESKVQSPKSKVFYGLSLLAFACGLMSKPMVVTLPFVLLLLDFWPLERFSGFTRLRGASARQEFQVSSSEKPSTPINHEQALNPQHSTESAARLIFEKLPFFALALAGSIVTYQVQKTAGAVWSAAAVSPYSHVGNALLSYLRYLSKCFWPVDLAVLYPYHTQCPAGLVIGAALLLAMWSGLFLWRARQNPYLLVGWLWFLGTLVPTIGIVQVGSQSIADRYLYLPSIGLFILIVWGLNDWLNCRPQWRPMVAVAGTAVLAGCLICARIQLGYWQDSLKLLTHTIAVTTDNYSMYNALGTLLEHAGQKDEAMMWYDRSIKVASHYPPAQYNLGMALLKRNWPEQAAEHLAIVAKLMPEEPGPHYSLGQALLATGREDDAMAQFTETLRLDPSYADAHNELAMIFIKEGKTNDAITNFSEAVRLRPNDAQMRFNLGLALLNNHQPAEAAAQFTGELRITPDETKAHFRLAQALQQQNELAGAIEHYREALRLTPEFPDAKAALDQILSTSPNLKAGP